MEYLRQWHIGLARSIVQFSLQSLCDEHIRMSAPSCLFLSTRDKSNWHECLFVEVDTPMYWRSNWLWRWGNNKSKNRCYENLRGLAGAVWVGCQVGCRWFVLEVTYNQRARHQIWYRQLVPRQLKRVKESSSGIYAPGAVRMILPPLASFPFDGFNFSIAVEPCLTARKHLNQSIRALHIYKDKVWTNERLLTRSMFINCFDVMSEIGATLTIPACRTEN